jgi:K+-transporting ATPase ATPase C chain
MLAHLRTSVVLLALFTVILGIAYPLAMTGLGQALLPHQANGSLIVRDGKIIGSELIGQAFARPDYFWGRPSAAGQGYDARSSSGSNLGPSSKALADRIKADAAHYGGDPAAIPSDLLTASASGLDPDISPAAARFQVARVASARNLPADQVMLLVERAIEPAPFGILGDPRVNVLKLNLALDDQGKRTSP